MDAIHFHLIFTHFPIVGTIIGIGILFYGQFLKNDEVKKVALFTFGVFATTGNLGGKIRHSEIRDTNQNNTSVINKIKKNKHNDEDEDD